MERSIERREVGFTIQEWKDHLESVCTHEGGYDAGAIKIAKRPKHFKRPWQIVHESQKWGTSTEDYETLGEAVDDFMALWYSIQRKIDIGEEKKKEEKEKASRVQATSSSRPKAI
jgi:hypothetical protein